MRSWANDERSSIEPFALHWVRYAVSVRAVPSSWGCSSSHALAKLVFGSLSFVCISVASAT